MSDTLQRIRTEAQNLTQAEREQLISVLSYDNRGATADLSRYEQDVFDVICQLSNTRMPIKTFLAGRAGSGGYGARKYRQQVEEILEFISEARKLLRPVQVSGLMATCLRCLASDLQSRGIPISPSTLMNSVGMLRHAVDQNFPGYHSAGHLHRLVPRKDAS